MTRKAGELKKRCWLAKQRLKMGYWDSATKSITDDRSEHVSKSMRIVAEDAKYIRGESDTAVSSPRDERMYKIVCEILDSNEVTLNPIGRLIERDVYDELDGAARQRYILELSEKFRELKERYYKEKTGA